MIWEPVPGDLKALVWLEVQFLENTHLAADIQWARVPRKTWFGVWVNLKLHFLKIFN